MFKYFKIKKLEKEERKLLEVESLKRSIEEKAISNRLKAAQAALIEQEYEDRVRNATAEAKAIKAELEAVKRKKTMEEYNKTPSI